MHAMVLTCLNTRQPAIGGLPIPTVEHSCRLHSCCCFAGACFGLLWGVALVYLANIIGQTLAFLLARSYLHDRLYDLVTSHWPQFTSIDAALRREGWRLVFVLRLSPCVPFVVLNYALGLTSISFLEYSLASAVAIIPFVVISVYLGLASGTALQLLENTRWANQPDRPLINPQSTHSGSKSVAQQIGAHMFSPPPAPPHGHLNAALSTAAATAESTGMYRDGDSGMEGASTTFVTIATCILAVVTALYAAWFIRRVTSEVLEEESCERVGSAGGLVGLSLFADSSIQIEPGPHRDVHGDASPPASTSSVSSPTLHAEKREAVNGAGGWQSPLRAASGPFQAALPRDTSQAVNGEGEQLIHAGGKGSGRHSRESSISSMHSSLQQRWPRWTGDLARNVAQAARTAVGVSMLPVVYTGDAQHSEASTQLVGLDKR